MPKIMPRNNNNTGERGESSKSATKEGLISLQYSTLSNQLLSMGYEDEGLFECSRGVGRNRIN